MTKKQQYAAIQKWFSHIEDDDRRRAEISTAKECIDLGILTYTEWAKTVLLLNRISPSSPREAAIELLSTISAKISAQLVDLKESTTSAMLTYFLGVHETGDLEKIVSTPVVKPTKTKAQPLKEKKQVTSKFFGNW